MSGQSTSLFCTALSCAATLLILALPDGVSAQVPRGLIYDPNPVRAGFEVSEVDLVGLPNDAITLNGNRVNVSTCIMDEGSCTSVQYAIEDSNGNYMYEPDEGAADDSFAEVNAYFHVQKAVQYFSQLHDLDWQCDCGGSSLRVLLDPSMENLSVPAVAFYQYNDCVSFRCGAIVLSRTLNRDGVLVDAAYDGDIAYHEYVHAVVDERTDNQGYLLDMLGASFEPGAVSEGIADYFSAVISGDPWIAEHFAGVGVDPESTALRDLSVTRTCTADLTGQRHKDGRILASALWEIRQNVSAEIFDSTVLEAALALGTTPTFAEFSEALLDVLASEVAEGQIESDEVSLANSVLLDRGLMDCQRIIALSENSSRFFYSGESLITSINQGVAPLHFQVDVPADTLAVHFQVHVDDPDAEIAMHIRYTDPVELLEDGSGVQSDIEIPITQENVEIQIDPELINNDGLILYGVIQTKNILQTNPWVSITYTRSTIKTSTGCSCRLDSSETSSPAFFVALSIVMMFLRRRRIGVLCRGIRKPCV